MKKIVGMFAVLMFGATLLAAAGWKHCDPAGTWYGVNTPYLLTITPKGEDSYTVVFQAVYDLAPYGYPVDTTWSGSMVQRGNKSFEARSIAMYVFAPEGSTESIMEMDIVHAVVQIAPSCEELTQTIDVFGAYFPFVQGETVPFVTPVDQDYLPGGATLVETYARMKELE